MKCTVGLGSNLGARLENLEQAAQKIRALPEASALRASPVLQNHALVPDNSDPEWNKPYLNAVLELEWTSTPQALLTELQAIERLLGRQKTERWAPRPIDLDILTFGDLKQARPELNIPHAEMLKRSFVLDALKHLNPSSEILRAARALHSHSPLWMGIVNLSPDSFSNEDSPPAARDQMTGNPETHIWDLGGESTRPGAQVVTPQEEWQRLRPAIEDFRSLYHGQIFRPWLSVDTRHGRTAALALEHGADWINDVSGLADPAMLDVLKSSRCQYVLMHSLGVPADPKRILTQSSDPVEEVKTWAFANLERLAKNGVDLARVIFDPGIGFGKTAQQSLTLLRRFEEFFDLPVRLLIAHSRKSFISRWSTAPAPGRDPETLGISMTLAQRGCDIIRVHSPELHQRTHLALQGALQ